MPVSLQSLVPNPDDLLALEAEEVAGVLLVHLSSFEVFGSGSSVVQNGKVSQYNFFLEFNRPPKYDRRQSEVERALMEAWNWLVGEGFLVKDATATGDWFFLSRRAQRIKSREDFSVYRKASLLPKGQLHPLIASKVYPAFLRGEYDTAVFQAFREIEIGVRTAAEFPAEAYGVSMMRDAFRPGPDPNKPAPSRPVTPGPLADTNLPIAEQEGMMNLFSGAIGLYKNPQSHRSVPTDAIDAAEVIVFASHLLRIVDRLSRK